jgi:hypothetical protein
MMASNYLILDRRGVPVRQQKFEVTQQLWHDNFSEARHRLQGLVQAKVVRRSQATIVRITEDGTMFRSIGSRPRTPRSTPRL